MRLSNENKLLLCCARTRISEDTLNEIKSIVSLPLNWQEVLRSASWHKIPPLLYHNLKNIPGIPQEVMDQLREIYYGNMARNMYLYAELRRVLEGFGEKGLDVIALKGVALAQSVYGDIALRPMGDIDLLIKEEDLFDAERIISQSGYISSGNKPLGWWREKTHHIRYIHPDNSVRFEIHWHITDQSHPLRIRVIDTDIVEMWWKRAQIIELSGKKVLTLCPDDLLLHLSLHFFKHRFLSQHGSFTTFTSRGALIQISDIFQTLRRYRNEINWARLRHESERCGISNIICSTLDLVREIMGDHDGIFHDALDGFTPENFDMRLIRLIQKRIFISEDTISNISGVFFQTQQADTFYKKARVLLRWIFPLREVLSKRYSVPSSSNRLYLYYLIHPFMLLLRYAGLLSGIPHLKEDVVINKWINSKD